MMGFCNRRVGWTGVGYDGELTIVDEPGNADSEWWS